jgi:N-acyl-D-aspartate/D-glutamate deacylase
VHDIAEQSGCPVSVSLMQTDWAPDRWRNVLDTIGGFQLDNLNVRAQIAPRPIGIFEGLDVSVNPFSDCPSYREVADRPLTDRVRQLRQSDRRSHIIKEHHGATDRVRNALLSDFDKMFPTSDPMNYEPLPNESIAAMARRQGRAPAELAYDTLLENDGSQLLYMPIFNWSHRSLDDVREMLLSPYALIGLSDAGAHCGSICDASFPITLLSHWISGRGEHGGIPLEHAVHMLTQRSASQVGWMDRGVIGPGYLADINLIDQGALCLRPPRMVQDLPAGGRRLLQQADGVVMTVKRGQITVDHGDHTGLQPGSLVRGSQERPA